MGIMLSEAAPWLSSHWPFVVTGLSLLALFLAPLFLKPQTRLGRPSPDRVRTPSDPDASQVLRQLRDLQGTFEGRLERLRRERHLALRRIQEMRSRGDTQAAGIYERDHYEALRLIRATEQVLATLKTRYHRIRAALYAAQDEQAKARTLEAQSRTEIDEWLAPEKLGRRSARHRTVDERLDLLVRQAQSQSQDEDAVAEPDWQENLRLIRQGLDHLDTQEVRP